MAMSKTLAELNRAVKGLRQTFLPTVFDPLGQYPNVTSVQANARAFVVLCHAELEHYLESLAKDTARKAEVVWQSHQRATKPLLFLMATYSEKFQVPIEAARGLDGPTHYASAVPRVFQKFYKKVADNHGVKEANCLSLFGPLGVPIAAYGAALLPALTSFGALRGTHAHHASRHIATPLDPETEFNRVNDLILELSALDQWFSGYRAKIR